MARKCKTNSQVKFYGILFVGLFLCFSFSRIVPSAHLKKRWPGQGCSQLWASLSSHRSCKSVLPRDPLQSQAGRGQQFSCMALIPRAWKQDLCVGALTQLCHAVTARNPRLDILAWAPIAPLQSKPHPTLGSRQIHRLWQRLDDAQ